MMGEALRAIEEMQRTTEKVPCRLILYLPPLQYTAMMAFVKATPVAPPELCFTMDVCCSDHTDRALLDITWTDGSRQVVPLPGGVTP